MTKCEVKTHGHMAHGSSCINVETHQSRWGQGDQERKTETHSAYAKLFEYLQQWLNQIGNALLDVPFSVFCAYH